jgi:hypothetical protein
MARLLTLSAATRLLVKLSGARSTHAYLRRKLTTPITPKAGPGAAATLRSLDDCAHLVGSLYTWRQARPHWEYCAELILVAARTGRRADVVAVGAQMERALRCEGWL